MSDLTKIDSVAGVSIYSVKGEPKSFLYVAGMAIDADGCPECYGPNNSGLDWTANGGTPGDNWWGGPVDSDGMPLVQSVYDPAWGMYVSATAHCDPSYPVESQYHYLDSSAIPFIVLPGQHSNGAKLGDAVLCYNTKTLDNCYGIYGDVGPSAKIGEASMRMAQALKISNDPKTGGTESKTIAYLVFPGSIGKWVQPHIWFKTANTLVSDWGGLARLKTLLKEIG
jgi:Fungal chitosanase of glycosyl hydrolase group 75